MPDEPLPETIDAAGEHARAHERLHAFYNAHVDGFGTSSVRQQLEWSGELAVVTGTRQIRIVADSALSSFIFSVPVAAEDDPYIFDLLLNGVSIFADPPEIAIGETFVEAFPVDPAALADDRLTLDVLQVDVVGMTAHVLGFATAVAA